jgi:hypothetical protein
MVFVPVGDKNCAAHDTAMRQDAKKIDLTRLFIPPVERRIFNSSPAQSTRVYFSAEEKLAQ